MIGCRLKTIASLLTGLLTIVTIPITWEQEDPEGYVTRWRVYRATSVTAEYSLLKTVTVKPTRVEVPLGESRCFRIAAVDVLGQTSPKSEYFCIHTTTETGP